jgi:hypothetical protein
MKTMKSNWLGKLAGIALLAIIVIAGFGQAVLQLWNLVVPDVFGLRPITFWQAVGLLALSWLLFGSGPAMFRSPRSAHWRHRMAERLEQMPAEERAMLRQGLKSGCRRSDESSREGR